VGREDEVVKASRKSERPAAREAEASLLATGLRRLGFTVVFEHRTHRKAVAPGVWLDGHDLHVSAREAEPGDLLHEAGHLALIPSMFRASLKPGDIEGPLFQAAILDFLISDEATAIGSCHWAVRALRCRGEDEAAAWAFAAATKLGFPTIEAFCYRRHWAPALSCYQHLAVKAAMSGRNSALEITTAFADLRRPVCAG
jgi:hypothetical protein